MGDMLFGKCEVCGKENVPLSRKYFYYDIACECHSPRHFVCVGHCKECKPKPPREIKVVYKGEDYFIEEEKKEK